MDHFNIRRAEDKNIARQLGVIKNTLKAHCCNKVKNANHACLCKAESIYSIIAQEGRASVTLPPNCCITKIYTAGDADSLSSIQITVDNGSYIFCQRVCAEKDSEGRGKEGQFETTLVQPLHVGENGATVIADFADAFADAGFLTVVYCKNCC